MPTEVTLPALGESVTEGTVSRWLKAVGDTMVADEPIVEVSTDKVDTEIPAPASGVLLEIRKNEDDIAEVGAVLGLIGEAAAEAPSNEPSPEPTLTAPPAPPAPPMPPAPPAPPVTAPPPQARPWEAPLVSPQPWSATPPPPAPPAAPASYIPAAPGSTAWTPRDPADVPSAPTPNPSPSWNPPDDPVDVPPVLSETPKTYEPPAPPEPVSEEAEPVNEDVSDNPETTSSETGGYVTPLVRKLAAEHGIDLADVPGSGVGGRVRKQDVLAYAMAKEHPAQPITVAQPDPRRGISWTLPPLRLAYAKQLTESLMSTVQLTQTIEIDMGNSLPAPGQSPLANVLKAAASALEEHAALNATFDEAVGTVLYAPDINIGVAMDTEWGSTVPVIRNAETLGVDELQAKLTDLENRIKARQLIPGELSGGSFTVTDFGVAGALFGTAVLNHPQTAALGVGRLQHRPVAVSQPDGQYAIEVRPVMCLTLSYDNRVVDSGDAAGFLARIKSTLESGHAG
jgi:2-oxoglutarate dehydrogenase E2 component (dihydrolipoamide succinyltransferase)